MSHLNLNECCAIDSDVLLFSPVDEARRDLDGYSMSFGRWDNTKLLPHFNVIQGWQAIDSFCKYVLGIFSDTGNYENFISLIKNSKGRSWVCDMSLFWGWSQSHKEFNIAIFEDLGDKGASFDSSISKVNEYAVSRHHYCITKRWKKLLFLNDSVQAFRCGNPVSMKFIHYHGKFKVLMKRHARLKADSPLCFGLLLREKAREFPAKLRLLAKNYLPTSWKQPQQ